MSVTREIPWSEIDSEAPARYTATSASDVLSSLYVISKQPSCRCEVRDHLGVVPEEAQEEEPNRVAHAFLGLFI